MFTVLKRIEKYPALAVGLSIGWVLFISWLAFGWQLGRVGLVDETEPLFAEAARQMIQTGDWVTPYFNGDPRFDKPPLVYWVMAIGFHLLGVNEWAVRLPSALAATAMTGLGFYTLRRFGFPQSHLAAATVSDTVSDSPEKSAHLSRRSTQALWLSAWIGAAAIGLNPETLVWGRIGVSDMVLTGCMAASLLAFFLAYAQPERPQIQARWYLAFYPLMALAVLAKGPVGVVLPLLIVGVFLLYTGKLWEVLPEMRLAPGVLLFVTLTLPWYGLVILANGRAYIDSFFGYHNFERFTNVVNGHAAPWFFYFLVVFIGFLPWSPFLPLAIARLRFWRLGMWRQQSRSSHLGLFAFIWFAVIFVFFTMAVTKLPSYVLPLMPAAAILVGLLWSDRMSLAGAGKKAGWGFEVSVSLNLGLLLLLSAAALYSPNWLGDDPAMPDLPHLVRQSGIVMDAAIIWAAAAIASLGLIILKRTHWLWSINLMGFIAFLTLTIMPTYQMADTIRQLPLRQIAQTIVAEQAASEEIIMTGFKKPSLVFYTQRPVVYLYSAEEVENHLQSTQQTGAANSLLLVGQPNEIDAIDLDAQHSEILLSQGAYQLVRVSW